ncbi:MAG: hypothetical protein WCY46_01585 [Tissierellaceae bacterium]
MRNNRVLKWFDNNIYLVVIGGLIIILGLFQPILGAIGGLLLGYLIFHNVKPPQKRARIYKIRREPVQ